MWIPLTKGSTTKQVTQSGRLLAWVERHQIRPWLLKYLQIDPLAAAKLPPPWVRPYPVVPKKQTTLTEVILQNLTLALNLRNHLPYSLEAGYPQRRKHEHRTHRSGRLRRSAANWNFGEKRSLWVALHRRDPGAGSWWAEGFSDGGLACKD